MIIIFQGLKHVPTPVHSFYGGKNKFLKLELMPTSCVFLSQFSFLFPLVNKKKQSLAMDCKTLIIAGLDAYLVPIKAKSLCL